MPSRSTEQAVGRTEANLPRLARHLSNPRNAARLFGLIFLTQLVFFLGLSSLDWFLGPEVVEESWPWISTGLQPVGIVAIGVQPTGVIAVGALPIGLISMGGFSLGVLISFGGVSLGVVSGGGVSLGVVSQGGVSVGWLSRGGFSAGWYSYGDYAVGAYAWGVRGAAGIYHSETFRPTGAGNQRAGV